MHADAFLINNERADIMEIALSSIIKKFQVITKLSDEEVGEYLFIVESAAEEINGKLLKPIITEGEKKAVENCAAACAVYDWLLYVYALPRTEISKTGVLFESSSQSENIKKAERMKNEALAKIAPLISDSDFVFTCV